MLQEILKRLKGRIYFWNKQFADFFFHRFLHFEERASKNYIDLCA